MEQENIDSRSTQVFNFRIIERNFSDIDGAVNVEALSRCEEMFRQVVGARIDALEGAIKSHQVKDLEMVAHQLKGSFLVLGSEALANACLELELQAEMLELEKMREIFVFIQSALPHFQAELSDAVARLKSTPINAGLGAD